MTPVRELLRRAGVLARLAVLAALLAGAGLAAPAAQAQPQSGGVIQGILVEGNQRIESQTVLSYLAVTPGMPFDPVAINTSLEVLFDTGLFADVVFERRGNLLVIRVVENPIINRVTFEGNRALDDEDLAEEIQAQPRAIFTRARVQADVQRMIEVYRQSGRFAAQITPQVVEQPQNRVDLVFEISEGPLTGVRRINFIGNEAFSDRRLRSEVVTRESRFWRFFSSNDNYDPARLEYDRELLREFYTDRGYADFRVVSAVAELTPDQEDFFITYVLDEGEVYTFGDISVVSEIEVLDEEALERIVPIEEGELYEQSRITDAEDTLTFAAGAAGYAFVRIQREQIVDREARTVSFVFTIAEGPRVYIERIDVVGNTQTLDQVIRREVLLVEGDAFNRVLLDRSRQRIRALGFFEEVEISELPGSLPDRALVQVQVTEQPTGELNFGAGFSSVDAFLVDLTITQRNLRGRGQFLRFRVQFSQRRQIVDIRFLEPRFMGRNLQAGFDIFNTRQDFLSEASFETESTGGSLNLGFPVTERASMFLRYTLRLDDVRTFVGASSPIALQQGERISSIGEFDLTWDRRNDPFSPSRGFYATLSQDFAGLGGDVRFLRSELEGAVYRDILPQFVASLSGSMGYVAPWGGDDVRINDRFFKGGQSFRGFETAGMGPRIVSVDSGGNFTRSLDALGGQFYAIGTAQLSIPLGLPEQYGIRGSLFSDFGYLGVLDDDTSLSALSQGLEIRDDLSLRASAGVSISWRSPFGPIQLDFSEVLAAEEYDRTETFRFSTRSTF